MMVVMCVDISGLEMSNEKGMCNVFYIIVFKLNVKNIHKYRSKTMENIARG